MDAHHIARCAEVEVEASTLELQSSPSAFVVGNKQEMGRKPCYL